MAIIINHRDVFKTFLTNEAAQVLIDSFPQDAKPLLNGVNYRFNGKVWNIRTAFKIQ